MVAIAINADFLFPNQRKISENTIELLNQYSSVSNQIKAQASFQTTWVNLWMMILDEITDGRQDDFMSKSTTYELHDFLMNAYLTTKERPDNPSWDNCLNTLLEGWYRKIYKIYFNSDLISPKLAQAITNQNIREKIDQEISLYKAAIKSQSLESKHWYQQVCFPLRG